MKKKQLKNEKSKLEKAGAPDSKRTYRRNKPVFLDLDPALFEAVQAQALADGRTQSETIRRMLRDQFATLGIEVAPHTPAKRGPKPGSHAKPTPGSSRGGTRPGAGRPKHDPPREVPAVPGAPSRDTRPDAAEPVGETDGNQ